MFIIIFQRVRDQEESLETVVEATDPVVVDLAQRVVVLDHGEFPAMVGQRIGVMVVTKVALVKGLDLAAVMVEDLEAEVGTVVKAVGLDLVEVDLAASLEVLGEDSLPRVVVVGDLVKYRRKMIGGVQTVAARLLLVDLEVGIKVVLVEVILLRKLHRHTQTTGRVLQEMY